MRSSLSFRDPDGSVLCTGDRVIRSVARQRVPDFTAFFLSDTARSLTAAEMLIGTREFTACDDDALLDQQTFAGPGRRFEHDRVWFPSYPSEWPPEMLFEAGLLTLEIAEATLQEGYGLKDATPFNVLFQGPNPVFVDVLSFERRSPADATWLPYAQFLRMFVLPLLAFQRFGMKPHELWEPMRTASKPEELYQRCSWFQRLRMPFLSTVSIPVWLGRRTADKAAYRPSAITKPSDPERTRFILRAQFRALRRLLCKVRPESGRLASAWSGYAAAMTYSPAEFETKRQCVERWLSGSAAKTVLDVGCNTGAFSEIAARLGAAVVALDSDPVVVGTVWKHARQQRLNVLPLVVDLAHPTPATGWANAENPSFLDRAAGRFDTVLMLALLHHLLVTERVPLPSILQLAANLTRQELILEYVDRHDPMFQQLLRGRDALHTGFTREFFENTCQQHFTILEKQPLKNNLRILYRLRKK